MSDAEHDVDDDVAERPPQVEEDEPDELEVRDRQLGLGDPDVVLQPDELGRDRVADPEVDLAEVVNDIQTWKIRG